MRKKVLGLFAVYNIVFLLAFLVTLFSGQFTETVPIQYVTAENSDGIETVELTGDKEVTFRFEDSFAQVNNLIFKFSGCQNHEAGVLSVRIHDNSEEYYAYEVPTYVFQEDIFYLYTNEVPGLQNVKKYNVTVAVMGMEQGSIFLQGTIAKDYMPSDGGMSPFWGVDGSVTQTSKLLGKTLLVWAFVDIVYAVAALLMIRCLTDERKEWLFNRLRTLGKAVYIRFGIFVVLCVGTIVAAVWYADELKVEQSFEYWTHHYVPEFINIPVKDGEILQEFTAGYDRMEQFILAFDHFAPTDEALVNVKLENAKGEELFSWCSETAKMGEGVFYLAGTPEKELHAGNQYYFRIYLDSPKSDITMRAVSQDGIHESAGVLTVGEETIEETVLYFFQSYRDYFSYAEIWICGLVVTLLLFLFIVFDSKENDLKIWSKVSVLLLVLVSYYNIESLSGNLATIEIKYVLVNCLILFGSYLALRAVLLRKAFYVTAVITLVVGLVNFYVLQFRGSEFLLSDIKSFSTAMSVAGNYEFTIPVVVFTSVLFTLCLILIQSTVDGKTNSIYVKSKIRMRVVQMVSGILLLVLVSVMAVTTVKLDEKAFSFFTLSNNFSKYGWCYSNVFVLRLSAVEKPHNYSDKQVESILAEMGDDTESDVEGIVPQNLIVIMNESLSDLSVVGELETNQDYMPYIRSLSENTVKGNLHVSTFGGNTCITEYEFLTGNTQHFLPIGSIPYSSMCEDEEAGMVKILQAQGYHAVAMHPYGPANWNRDTVYPAMGFDEFLSIDEYEGAEMVRNYVSDKADYQKIIDYYENFDKDEKLFIFNVTMQNHGGFDINNGVMDTTITIENFDSSVGETYLSLVHESDKAFEYLLSYFSKVDEPTMIVMFGDHLPSLPDSFYEMLYGKALEQRDDMEISHQYITPYVIWTNYDTQFEQVSDISVNYLGSYVLQCAGLKLPEYNTFLLEQRKRVPVVGMYGILDADGNYILYEEVPANLLNYYQNLQYMRLEDRESQFYNIFGIE